MKLYIGIVALTLAILPCKLLGEPSKPQAHSFTIRPQTATDIEEGGFFYLVGGTGMLLSFFDAEHRLLDEYPYFPETHSIFLETEGWISIAQLPSITTFPLDLEHLQSPH